MWLVVIPPVGRFVLHVSCADCLTHHSLYPGGACCTLLAALFAVARNSISRWAELWLTVGRRLAFQRGVLRQNRPEAWF